MEFGRSGCDCKPDRAQPSRERSGCASSEEEPLQIDDKLKGLIKELGDAINGALSQSVEINDAIQNVRDAGYEVVLALEATIGFNKKPGGETSEESSTDPVAVDAKL